MVAALAIMCAGLAGVMPVLARGNAQGRRPAATLASAQGRGNLAARCCWRADRRALLMAVAIVSLLPSYLSTQMDMSTTAAGATTAGVAAASIRYAAAAILLPRGVRPGLLACSMLRARRCSRGLRRRDSLPARVGAAAALIFVAIGIAASGAYASSPRVTRLIDDLPVANGVIDPPVASGR